MFPNEGHRIVIARSYLKRRLLFLGSFAGPFPVLLAYFGFVTQDYWTLFISVGFAAFLGFVLSRTCRRGVKQSIVFLPKKIVFDYLAHRNELAFESLAEWEISDETKNWRIVSTKDQSSLLIPKRAFPLFELTVAQIYGKKI